MEALQFVNSLQLLPSSKYTVMQPHPWEGDIPPPYETLLSILQHRELPNAWGIYIIIPRACTRVISSSLSLIAQESQHLGILVSGHHCQNSKKWRLCSKTPDKDLQILLYDWPHLSITPSYAMCWLFQLQILELNIHSQGSSGRR